MGSDDLFKKRRADRRKRDREFKNPKANSFLIVTEGKRTEPLYFKGLATRIKEQIGGNVEVYEVPQIDIHGEGCATNRLIEKTDEIVNKSKIRYQNILVVFDKDDFIDFDEAVAIGKRKEYNIAWSNQSFEYWLYLHFEYSESALHRHEWNKKLSEIFKKYQLGSEAYYKNDENIYALVDTYDGVATAIKNAKRRMAKFDEEKDKPSSYDPGTTVYQLVEQLKQFLE